MKYLILFFALFLSAEAIAEVTPQPAYLKDAKIVVVLKDGSIYEFDANTHAVVPRIQAKSAAVATTPAPKEEVIQCVQSDVVTAKGKKHRLRAFGGYGPDGVDVKKDGDDLTIRQSRGEVFGLGYDYLMDNDVSVGVQGMTNSTFTLGLGVELE